MPRRYTARRRVARRKRSAPRRRSYGRKRTTTRRTGRRPMTRRHILNLTSTKKRDTMMSVAASGVTTTTGPITLTGGTGVNATFGVHFIPWIATARDLTTSAGIANQRTASTCYMVGLREEIRYWTNTSRPWQWRRICFTFKGDSLYKTASGVTVAPWLETSTGWTRLLFNLSASTATADQLAVGQNYVNHIFQGSYGTDYGDIFHAKTDTRIITPKFDRIRTIKSTNNSGTLGEAKMWHGMRHNINYEDDEVGDEVATAFVSTEGKPGMGDYYVLDMFKCHADGTTSDSFSFYPTSSLHWHEK